MELKNIFKTLINNLKKYYLIFIGIWFAIGIILFLPVSRDNTLFALLYLFYLISSLFLSIVIGSLTFGSYGKTFILVQNNRKNYVICSLLFCLTNSFVFTLIAAFLRIKSEVYYLNPMDFSLFIILMIFYIFTFSLGSLYGSFVKYNKKVKRIVYLVLFFILIILGYFFIPVGLEIVVALVEFEADNFFLLGLLTFIFDILLMSLCSLYYLNLNILKVYSNNE